MRHVWRWSGPLAAALVTSGAPVHAQTDPAALASAPIDPTIYRAGAVTRWRRRFESWSVACDEIARLAQRYCSLAAPILGPGDEVVGRIDVSTDDHGRPTAMLHLPSGLSLRDGVTVGLLGAAAAPLSTATRPVRGRRLDAAACTMRECDVIWSLTDIDFRGLNATGLALRYVLVSTATWPSLTLDPRLSRPISAHIAAAGFSAGIRASLAPTLATP